MYPIKFENLYYERIWGGNDLEKFRDDVPTDTENPIGESWDIACHKNGTGVVANGALKGKTFDEIIKEFGHDLVGKKMSTEQFPLLIKLITAKEKLSVQVHPNDEYAKRVENDLGKTESWYVMDAAEDACLIVGTKDCDKEKFRAAIESGNLEPCLNKIPVKKGDFFYIKSGLVHAICEGILVAEIQQSSDTTYRVYDYNRGREIHVDKALDVIDFSLKGENCPGVSIKGDGYEKTYLCVGDYFTVQKYDIKTCVEEVSDEDRFYLFTCVDGEGVIKFMGGMERIAMGDSILIPASLGKYELCGNFTLLKSYVPDVKDEAAEILKEVVK